MVEHVEHGPALRLGPVNAHQHRPGDVQAALAQPDQRVGDHGGVLGGAFDECQRVLVPVDVDTQRHVRQVSAKLTPSTIRTESRCASHEMLLVLPEIVGPGILESRLAVGAIPRSGDRQFIR